jgi:hypothetical protein
MNRRTLLKGLVATTAGLLIPEAVAVEPERRIWAFPTNPLGGRGARATIVTIDEAAFMPPLAQSNHLYMGSDPGRPERFVAMSYDEYERRMARFWLTTPPSLGRLTLFEIVAR